MEELQDQDDLNMSVVGRKVPFGCRSFGNKYLYKWWKKACSNLGIEGVDLYGGTRHTSTTTLTDHFTPEEIRSQGHSIQQIKHLIDIFRLKRLIQN